MFTHDSTEDGYDDFLDASSQMEQVLVEGPTDMKEEITQDNSETRRTRRSTDTQFCSSFSVVNGQDLPEVKDRTYTKYWERIF